MLDSGADSLTGMTNLLAVASLLADQKILTRAEVGVSVLFVPGTTMEMLSPQAQTLTNITSTIVHWARFVQNGPITLGKIR